MENRGAVNCYEPDNWFGGIGSEVYSVNLATGVTPFVLFMDGKEYVSMCYRLRTPVLVDVKIGWYRPTAGQWHQLSKSVQEHVLNGGLLHGNFDLAISLQMPEDVVEVDWDYERFQAWAFAQYGSRLPATKKE